MELGKDGAKPVGLRPADEEDVARVDVLHSAEIPNDEGAAVGHLAAHGFLERTAEGILPEHADDEGRGRRGKTRGRPLDKLREIEEENRLDLIGRGGGIRRHAGLSGGREPQDERKPDTSAADPAAKKGWFQ